MNMTVPKNIRTGGLFLPLAALCFFSLPATASAALSPYFIPARTSGVAPLAVFFDTASSTSASTTDSGVTTKPFHDLDYAWDFGDPTAGVWTYGTASSSKNVASGPEAAHVFETPGTYTVTMTVKNGTNTAATTTTITVTDPETVFSGTNTICFSTSSTFTDCPSGATQIATTTFASAVQIHQGTNKRLLFRGGEIFASPAAATLSIAGPGIIGSYGTGKAILRFSGAVANGTPILKPTTATDWRVMDLDFDGQGTATNAYAITGGSDTTPPNQLLMLRLYMHDIGGAIELPPSNTKIAIQDQLFLIDSQIQRLIGSISLGHGILSAASQTAIIGNLFDDSATALSEHMIRIAFMDRGVISNNQIQNVKATKEMIALRSVCQAASPCTSGNYYPNMGLSGDNATTRKVVISDNVIKTNTYVGVKVMAVNTVDLAYFRDIIIERNFYQTQTTTENGDAVIIGSGTSYVTVRNELADTTNGARFGHTAFSTSEAAAAPASDNISFYNNTVYDASASSTAIRIRIGSTNISVKNNLSYAPNAIKNGAGSTNFPVLLHDSTGVAASSTNSTNSQVKNTSPLFVNSSGSFSAPSDFTLQVGSYAIGTGTSTPSILGMVYDFSRTLRQAVTSIGAYDLNPPTVTTEAASSITTTTATLNGTITVTGGATPTTRGFAWGTSTTLSGGDTATTTENGSFSTGAFTNTSLTLTCNTTYYARAYAINSAGTSLGAISASFTTSACPDTTAPSIPSSPAFDSVTASSLNFTWASSTDAVGVTGYRVYRNNTFLATSTILSYTDSGLTASTLYAYNVSAFDAATNVSATTTTVSTTTLATTDSSASSAVDSSAGAGAGGGSPTLTTVILSSEVYRASTTPTTNSSGLSKGQIGAIITLLISFNIDQSTIHNVTLALHGTAGRLTSITPTISFTRNLQLYATGPDVLALQQYLNTHGFPVASTGPGSPGHETTTFGVSTYYALIKFQLAQQLSQTGYFGPRTRKVIESL